MKPQWRGLDELTIRVCEKKHGRNALYTTPKGVFCYGHVERATGTVVAKVSGSIKHARGGMVGCHQCRRERMRQMGKDIQRQWARGAYCYEDHEDWKSKPHKFR